MGGPAVFSTLVGPGWGTIWLPSLRHRGRFQREPPTKFKTQPKNVTLKNQRFQFWRWLLKTATQGSSWAKTLHRKSKILIKGDVSKFRYFQHACQSGPKINHSRSIHLSALPKHLGGWCLIGIVSFITNIFHRGGIIHKTETKKGHKNRSDSDCDAWLLYLLKCSRALDFDRTFPKHST